MTNTAPHVDYVHPPLVEAAIDIERHVASAGWDQPVRLFALVPTADLAASEPGLAADLEGHRPEELSAIEQEDLPAAESIETLLAQLAWPAEVAGVALAVERLVVPPEAERDLPTDPDEAARVLAEHPDRADVRILAAVLRSGARTCLLRQRAHDSDDAVAIGDDLAPGLVAGLAATLED